MNLFYCNGIDSEKFYEKLEEKILPLRTRKLFERCLQGNLTTYQKEMCDYNTRELRKMVRDAHEANSISEFSQKYHIKKLYWEFKEGFHETKIDIDEFEKNLLNIKTIAKEIGCSKCGQWIG